MPETRRSAPGLQDQAGRFYYETMDEKNFYAIKALDDWRLEILAVPFGNERDLDAQGEYFNAQTNIHKERFPEIPLVYYHGFTPDRKPSETPEYIGVAKYDHTDESGHWYIGILDKTNDFAKRVWQAAKDMALRASTGSILHLVRYVGRWIREWPVAELSLIDARGRRQPSNQRAVALPVMKAVYERAGISLPDGLEDEPEASVRDAAAEAEDLTNTPDTQEAKKMTDQLDPKVQAQLDRLADLEKKEQEREAQAKVEAAVKAALDEQKKEHDAEIEQVKAEAAKGNRLEDSDLPDGVTVAKYGNLWKYDNLDPDAHSLAAGILMEAKRTGKSESGASEDLLKSLAIKMVEGGDKFIGPRMAMKAAGMPTKANELNQSTLANYGDEWVPEVYSNQLWENIRLEVRVAAMMPTVVVPQGAESITIPVQSTPPTFYKVAQASAQTTNTLGAVTNTHTSSKMGTANQSLTVAKMGARTIYTGELEEDSLINWADELNRAIVQEGAEVLEHVIIDGDTATDASTNINDIGGTPAGSEAFLLFNGLRKLALVTNTANSRDAGAFGVEDFLETIKLMGLGGKNAIQKDKVKFIIDLWTNWKALELPEVKTKDTFSRPTIEAGVLTGIWGYDVITTANMHRANQDATYGLKANSAGKVDLDTAANNLYGAILAFRPDQWRLGYKRRMKLETTRVPAADATEIVANMRVGLIYRDTEASAISYNVGV